MKSKTIFRIIIPIIISGILILWSNGALNPNKTRISDDVYLEHNSDEDYTIYCRIGGKQKIIATSVDSIILTPKYGTMIFGIGKKKKVKQWHYIDASSSKNIYGGWNDSIFRNESIVTIGREFLNSVNTSKEIWDKNI